MDVGYVKDPNQIIVYVATLYIPCPIHIPNACKPTKHVDSKAIAKRQGISVVSTDDTQVNAFCARLIPNVKHEL